MLSSDYSPQDKTNARHYRQLGLEPGAPMRDVEAAYWKFARELKGQPAMAPYNVAYEALARKAHPAIDKPGTAEPTTTPSAAKPTNGTRPARPPSKFGWPAL